MKRSKLFNNAKKVFLAFTALCFTSCYTWWEEKIDVETGVSHISLGDFLFQKPAISSLEAPSQVIASQGTYSGEIRIRWTEVPNATSYRIERAVVQDSLDGITLPNDDAFEVIEKHVYSSPYTDKILQTPGSSNEEYTYKYFYRISAENLTKGYESSEYTDISVLDTQGLGWLLPAPQNVDAWKGKETEEIRVTWKAVKGASYYKVYRGQNHQGRGMELISEVRGTLTQYSDMVSRDEQGKDFYYKVQAVLSNGSSSADSELVLGYALSDGAPKTPENVTTIDASGNDAYGKSASEIQIFWNKVSGASTDTITYSVYRNSNINSNYTLVMSNIPQGGSETMSITDTVKNGGLKPGVKYYYYVQTVCQKASGEIFKSAFSSSEGDTAMGFLVSPPSYGETTDGSSDSKVVLRWSPALRQDEAAEDSYTYNIYMDSELAGSYSTLIESSLAKENLSYDKESGLYSYEVEKYPFYKITTTNESGVQSAMGSALAPNPVAPVDVVASKTEGGSLISDYQPNTNQVYPVRVSWKAPTSETPAGYNVYRSTKADSSFRKLNDTPLFISDVNASAGFTYQNGVYSFIDENSTAQPGTFYYYKIISLNALGQGQKSNDPSEATGAIVGSKDCRGYGAITRDQWFREYNKTVMKSQSKLTLMHKAVDTDKLGKETINGDISGTLSYNAAIAGLGAEIKMPYKDYADFYIANEKTYGVYFNLTGNTDTTSNMSANGNMSGTVVCTGMYPGTVNYNKLEIKKGAAGGGYYAVETRDLSGVTILSQDAVDWKVGEEH